MNTQGVVVVRHGVIVVRNGTYVKDPGDPVADPNLFSNYPSDDLVAGKGTSPAQRRNLGFSVAAEVLVDLAGIAGEVSGLAELGSGLTLRRAASTLRRRTVRLRSSGLQGLDRPSRV